MVESRQPPSQTGATQPRRREATPNIRPTSSKLRQTTPISREPSSHARQTTPKALCTCTSYGCSQQKHIDKSGEMQPGLTLSLMAVMKHRLADERLLAVVVQPSYEDDFPREAEDQSLDDNSDPECHENRPPTDLTDPLPDLNKLVISNNESTPPSENNQLEPYDCARLYADTLIRVNPTVLHVSIVAAILAVHENCGKTTMSWFLKTMRDLIQIPSPSVTNARSARPTVLCDRMVHTSIPLDIRTIIKWLNIDPLLHYLICCPNCFAMYHPSSKTPARCLHRSIHIRREDLEDLNDLEDLDDLEDLEDLKDLEAPSDHSNVSASLAKAAVCGAQLFQNPLHGNPKPVRRFAFQDLFNWLARLFSQPGVESALSHTAMLSGMPHDPEAEVSDIHGSRIWKAFLGPDGSQFTSQANNITFGMFIDGINPFGNKQAGKHVSISFLIMVCLSLPINLRYKPQNTFLVAIAPGPKEPSLEQINWILRPVIHQLTTLWTDGLQLSRTAEFPKGRHVRAALLPFFADLPAIRRALGFPAPTATRMCSMCLLPKAEINNFKPSTWPKRHLEHHNFWARKSRDAATVKEQRMILRNHGVRYSVLLELPYWNILNYHIVDAMHNLLLGLLKWHAQRFWLISDSTDEKKPAGVSTRELSDLLADSLLAASVDKSNDTPQLDRLYPNAEDADDDTQSGIAFNDMDFASHDSADDTFRPFGTDEGGWDGPWTAPSDGDIVFGSNLLSYVNAFLPRLHIPTWIKRALPVLGKASHGRLKADEWRNLFTIQLPLILPIYWNKGCDAQRSLFRNFAHLVSLVNLATKRTTSHQTIRQYRAHIIAYLESSITLFPDVKLAPNHHMAIHLADSLENFGPCRGWWSFPMERLMGRILKASHNNRLGQLEITFLINFCRTGNLNSLLNSSQLPAALEPLLERLRNFDSQPAFAPQVATDFKQSTLSDTLFRSLVDRINERYSPEGSVSWISSDEWYKKSRHDREAHFPVTSKIRTCQNIAVGSVVYSVFTQNKSNSFVSLKMQGQVVYGLIEQIFEHTRPSKKPKLTTETWFAIKPLLPFPSSANNPFAKLDVYCIQASLRVKSSKAPLWVIHLDEIVSHCAWVMYKPGEVAADVSIETFGIVSLDR